MKKILYTLLLMTSSFSFGQDNWQPSDSSSYWEGKHSHAWFQSFFKYYTRDSEYDTLINDKVYSKLYFDSGDYYGSYSENNYFCSFRSDADEKSIYLVPKDSTEEYLFFNFGIDYELGDTIYNQVYFLQNGESPLLIDDVIILAIDSIEIDEVYYRNFAFFEPDLSVSERFISSNGFPFIATANNTLKCYGEGEESIMGSHCPYTFDFFQESASINEDPDHSIKVFPNPMTSHISFITQKTTNGKLFSSEGKLLSEFQIDSKNQTIDVSHLNPGLYYYTLSNSKINYSGHLIKE